MSADSTLHFNNTSGQTPGSVARDKESAEITIYPNPFTDEITIDIERKGVFRLFDSLGRMVMEVEVDKSASINTSDLSEGLYTYQLEVPGEIRSGKLVK